MKCFTHTYVCKRCIHMQEIPPKPTIFNYYNPTLKKKSLSNTWLIGWVDDWSVHMESRHGGQWWALKVTGPDNDLHFSSWSSSKLPYTLQRSV